MGERIARLLGVALRGLWARRLELFPAVAGLVVLWVAVVWDRPVWVSGVAAVNMLGLWSWSLVTARQLIQQRAGTLGWAIGLVLTADLVVSATTGWGDVAAVVAMVIGTFVLGLWWALRSPCDETARGYRARLRRRRNIRAAQDALDRACWATRSTELQDPPLVRSVRNDRWGETWSLSLRPGATVAVLEAALRSLESAHHLPPMSMTARADSADASKATLRIATADPLADSPGLGPWTDPDRLKASARKPVPVGVNANGKPVTIDLTETNHLAVGVTRSGKSWWLRQIATWWALAPDASDPIIITLKRSGDWAPLRAAGIPVIADITEACRVLIGARQAMESRAAEMEAAGVESVAHDTRFDYQPIVIDEAHALWLAGPDLVADRDLLKQAQTAVVMLASQGVAAGFVMAFGTQRSNIDFFPGAVTVNVGGRWVGRTATARAGQDALGVPSEASPEAISEHHQGRAYVTQEGRPREVRTWAIDDVTIARHMKARTEPTETTVGDPGNDTDRAVLTALDGTDMSPTQVADQTGLALSTVTRSIERLNTTGAVIDLTPTRTRGKRWTTSNQPRSNTNS